MLPTLVTQGRTVGCPFHRRNDGTDCKKCTAVSSLDESIPLQQRRYACARRLAAWCMSCSRYTRQRDRVKFTRSLSECPPALEFLGAGRGVQVPERHAKTDVEWDSEASTVKPPPPPPPLEHARPPPRSGAKKQCISGSSVCAHALQHRSRGSALRFLALVLWSGWPDRSAL